MKKIIIVFVIGLLVQQITQAQGTTFLSNLDQPSVGSIALGSDSWLATEFYTGNNVAGYSLNSIQLEMTGASGSPNDFTVMLYTEAGNISSFTYPGVSLGTLNGSTDPSTAGIFTYTPTANLTLLRHTGYFIVLTAGTAVADGYYEWSFEGRYPYNSNNGWIGMLDAEQSSDGLSWSFYHAYGGQYVINATAIPEPSSLCLLLLGSGGLIYARRNRRIS